MPAQTDVLGLTAGFIHGYIGQLAQNENKERELLVNAINQAVANGQPETLSLLNPERLQRYGMDQLLPAYHGFATAMKQKNEMAMREMVAKTGLAESQARVAQAVEEPTIQAANQKAAMGGIELQQAEMVQQAMVDNPRLLMLPQEKMMKEIEFTDAKIKAQAEETKLQWAQLAAQERHWKASEARASAGPKQSPLEIMMVDMLKGLPPEEQKEALLNKFSPGLESNVQKTFNTYNNKLEGAQKTWQAVAKSIDESAKKAGKEPLQYDSEEAAIADMTRLNSAAAQSNSIADMLKNKFGDERPQFPMYEVAPIPGRLYGVKGYQLITKQPNLADELRSIGIDLSTLGVKPKAKAEEKTPTVETPVLAPQSGRRIAPETNRGRAERGPIGETASPSPKSGVSVVEPKKSEHQGLGGIFGEHIENIRRYREKQKESSQKRGGL